MKNITKDYINNPDYIKNEIKLSVGNYNWETDTRVPIAGWGVVNPTFSRYFVIGSGVIGNTDSVALTVRKDGEDTGEYRLVNYAGSDWNLN